jgi:hypothetical protein
MFYDLNFSYLSSKMLTRSNLQALLHEVFKFVKYNDRLLFVNVKRL